jgi:hypothetical protein
MVEIKLTINNIGDDEAGIITVNRIDCPEPCDMGKIRFESAAERKWWLMVLMEFHPHVSLAEECKSFDPNLENMFKDCCKY